MSALAPLTVAVPLLTAASLTAFGRLLPLRADELFAIAASAATTVMSAILVLASRDEAIVYWFGGWEPRSHDIALGVSFTVEPLGAALALLAAVLATASFVFSWRYFDEVGTLFHVLVLIFLGAMEGFALTGDLFNMFVFFELMSVAAFALCGYRVERPNVLQGAINFAVTNTIGAFLVLFGIALLYGRTGALNIAQIGETLAGRKPDGLVLVAFALLASGFLVKGGAVPFHFWMSDAYAVAPTPVCVLFAGVMSDLGFHAVVRLYWEVFSGALGDQSGDVRAVLLAVGLVTALVGGTMALLQGELKRLVAFVVIAHGGIILTGIALLTPGGLGGAAVYVFADGLVKAALFLAVGIVLYRLRSGDELDLRGRGRRLVPTAVLFGAAAIGLTGAPPFGTFAARAAIERSALDLGYGWVPPLLVLATILSAAAVLRAGGRIFLGIGDAEDPALSRDARGEEEEEPQTAEGRSPLVMLGPTAVVLAAAIALTFVPKLTAHAELAAARFQDRADVAAEVLRGEEPRHVFFAEPRLGLAAWLSGVASLSGAAALALFLLYRRRLSSGAWRLAARVGSPPLGVLRAAHSGVIGDYVMWLSVGTAAIGGAFALLIR
jgi:multicomponent Na+:H+ antiporter subunit D